MVGNGIRGRMFEDEVDGGLVYLGVSEVHVGDVDGFLEGLADRFGGDDSSIELSFFPNLN